MKATNTDNVFVKKKELYTRNAYPGKTHFDENTIETNGQEYRKWDPYRSKLGAALMKGANFSIKKKDVVLYLGAGHGFTPSFVSDIVSEGMVFCIDPAPRVVRDLIFLCEQRDNMAPILADANQPDKYKELIPKKVDIVFQDVAQKNQVEIFLKNMKFLKQDGYGLLSVKARSIDVSRKPSQVFKEVENELREKLKVVDMRRLEPFEKDHCFFVAKNS